jgi:hypothetical protein
VVKEENGVIPVVDNEPVNPYIQKDEDENRESVAINDFNEDNNAEEEKRSLDSQEIGEKEEQIDSFV